MDSGDVQLQLPPHQLLLLLPLPKPKHNHNVSAPHPLTSLLAPTPSSRDSRLFPLPSAPIVANNLSANCRLTPA